MDVSVIIVNYNTYELTSACIESIIENTTNISYENIFIQKRMVDLVMVIIVE